MKRWQVLGFLAGWALAVAVPAALAGGADVRDDVLRAPTFTHWLMRNFRRAVSYLKLRPEQRREIEAEKGPLRAALAAATAAEKARAGRMRALFARPHLSIDAYEALAKAQRSAAAEASARVRAATVSLVVGLHRVLDSKQRERLVGLWAEEIERRYERFERPLH